MQVAEIKDMAERQPFRPFGVRLVNGEEYWFEQPRDLRAPKNYRMLYFFGEERAVRIDTDCISEIIERVA